MFMQNRVAPASSKRDRVYANFDKNLDEIVTTGLAAGAKVILNTVAVNLKDSPPFASMLNSNLPPERQQEFTKNYARAKELEAQGNHSQAAVRYEQALNQDETFAEAQYRLGLCLMQMTNQAEAARHLQLACDTDALPFRTDARLNALIRAAGGRFAPRGLLLCDAAVALDPNQPGGVYGRENFYEHVHFNFAGNYRLARLWAADVAKTLPPDVIKRQTSEWADEATCARGLGLTDWNRVFVMESVLERLQQPLLGSQYNNTDRKRLLQEAVQQFQQQANPAAAAEASKLYQEAIKRSPEDHLLYENFAKFLEATKKLPLAVQAWKQVIGLLPNNARANYQAGRLVALLNQPTEAEAFMKEAIRLNPELAEAWFEMGHLHLRAERFTSALADYEQAARLEPRNGAYLTFVGKALGKLNRPTEAMERYQQALKLHPDLWLAHLALGDALATSSQFEAAGREFAEVIRLRPNNAVAHFSLGLIRVKLGHSEEALREFEEVVRIEPANQAARNWIAQLSQR